MPPRQALAASSTGRGQSNFIIRRNELDKSLREKKVHGPTFLGERKAIAETPLADLMEQTKPTQPRQDKL